MLDDLLSPAPDQVLKVTQLTRQIKTILEGQFQQVWVQGEVSNLRQQSSGHVYFSLKDAGSQLPCVLFARDAAAQSFQLEDGMELQVFGNISVYEPHGRYQLIAKIAIRSGEGRLQLEFERLKRKLAAEGLFETSKKQTLPSLPQRIAVITSPTGAAVRDFLQILKRRKYHGEVVICPARVQGKGAADEIIAMLKYVNTSQTFDLIVLTRGGGSIEDLWAFNEETLARAVTASRLPTISAVGHEIDHVLTDYTADYRAETPSGAAELISSLNIEAIQHLEAAASNLEHYAQKAIDLSIQTLLNFAARLQIIAPERQIELQNLRLDDLENRLQLNLRKHLHKHRQRIARQGATINEQHPRNRIKLLSLNLDNREQQLIKTLAVARDKKTQGVDFLETRLKNSSLTAALNRGFSVITNRAGKVVDSAHLAKQQAKLNARFHDGKVDMSVDTHK